MRTAEEWDKIFWGLFNEDMPSHAIEHFVRTIQADGLRHSRDIVNKARFDGHVDLRSIASMIETEAQQLDPT